MSIKDYELLTGEPKVGIVASNKSTSNFKPAPEGTHLAICTMMVDLGNQIKTWQGEDKLVHQVYIGFTLPNEPVEYERDGEQISSHMVVGNTYTLSLHEKSRLRKDLESWRGKKFTKEEEDGFDILKVLGVPCLLSIVHNETPDRIYANISSISAVMKGMEVPQIDLDLIAYHEGDQSQEDKLPQWIRNAIGLESAETTRPAPTTDDDDIPF